MTARLLRDQHIDGRLIPARTVVQVLQQGEGAETLPLVEVSVPTSLAFWIDSTELEVIDG